MLENLCPFLKIYNFKICFTYNYCEIFPHPCIHYMQKVLNNKCLLNKTLDKIWQTAYYRECTYRTQPEINYGEKSLAYFFLK